MGGERGEGEGEGGGGRGRGRGEGEELLTRGERSVILVVPQG